MNIALVASDSNIDLNDSFIVVPSGLFLITGYFMFGESLINTLSPHFENAVAQEILSRQKDYLSLLINHINLRLGGKGYLPWLSDGSRLSEQGVSVLDPSLPSF
mgnify:CR=1 FL=1